MNPEVKKALTATDMRTAAWGAVATTIVEETEIKNRPSVSPQEIWNLRPSWTKEEYIYKDKNYGKREAHYLLGMVGLSLSFNDAKATTFEMVKEKFREAAQLARELGI